MKDQVISLLSKIGLDKKEIETLIEVPKDPKLGDYAFPCFSLAKKFKKSPAEIAKELKSKIKESKNFERIEVNGPYLNFFVNSSSFAEDTLNQILLEKDKYGSSKIGKSKTMVIDLSAPNIAKPFGIGHLRSTIIGNSISEIAKFIGYKTVKINYLGDWGTQFGKLIVGYKRFGDDKKLKSNPINHLLEVYVKANKEDYEDEARLWFKKMEEGDKEALSLWKKFKDLSLKEFEEIYKMLNINFDVISGESLYNSKMSAVIKLLEKKKLIEDSEGAKIVNLEKFNLGVCLIQKNDGTTLYATRDIAAAIDRQKQYKFDKMIYEVGSEQTLHFRQVFKVLELLGFSWAKECAHVAHGLYLDQDGKKFATRKGKTVFMKEILEEIIDLAKKEIKQREKLSSEELELRANKIALAAIVYGDLKNYRLNDLIFDIEKFLSFEGNTGPYLLYSYARAQSILKKSKFKKTKLSIPSLSEQEKQLISELSKFPEIVQSSFNQLAPNIIANYSFELAQKFNEFYHSSQVIGSEHELFRISLVSAFSQVLNNALSLLGIQVLEKM